MSSSNFIYCELKWNSEQDQNEERGLSSLLVTANDKE